MYVSDNLETAQIIAQCLSLREGIIFPRPVKIDKSAKLIFWVPIFRVWKLRTPFFGRFRANLKPFSYTFLEN